MGNWDEASIRAWSDAFRRQGGETLKGLLEQYQQAARKTDESA